MQVMNQLGLAKELNVGPVFLKSCIFFNFISEYEFCSVILIYPSPHAAWQEVGAGKRNTNMNTINDH